jgi:nickel/cobalt exporter
MDLAAIEDHLIRLFDSPGFLGTALVVAFVVGAFHAVAPGHGKSITAAYLVAGEARRRDALVLGSTVAAMHTISVAVLAVSWVALSAASTFATDVVTAWMQVAAAVVVVGVGLVLVWQRATGRGHHHHHHHDHHHGAHDHHHGAHDHHHGAHDEQHGAHDHRRGAPEPVSGPAGHGPVGVAVAVEPVAVEDPAAPSDLTEPVHVGAASAPSGRAEPEAASAPRDATEPPRGASRRMILALATAGGLLPSPSAFLVLVSGMLTGRVVYAVVLVLMFALGMAVTLSAVGLATIRGREYLARRRADNGALLALHRAVPVVGAVGVLVGGLVYLGLSLRFVL